MANQYYNAMPSVISNYYPAFLKNKVILPVIGGIMFGTIIVVAGIVAIVAVARKKKMIKFANDEEPTLEFSGGKWGGYTTDAMKYMLDKYGRKNRLYVIDIVGKGKKEKFEIREYPASEGDRAINMDTDKGVYSHPKTFEDFIYQYSLVGAFKKEFGFDIDELADRQDEHRVPAMLRYVWTDYDR